MKLKFKAVTVKHFSCKGINLDKGQIGEFDDELARSIMSSFPSDFEVEADKEFAAKDNKQLKKTVKFKAKTI